MKTWLKWLKTMIASAEIFLGVNFRVIPGVVTVPSANCLQKMAELSLAYPKHTAEVTGKYAYFCSNQNFA